MKKLDWKKMSIWFAALLILAADLIAVSLNLHNLNILIYLLAIGFGPAVVLFIASLLYASGADTADLPKYIVAVSAALLFAVIMMIYSKAAISEEIVREIIQHSTTSDTTQVSMKAAGAGDNIQSILLFVACSGIGCFIGSKIKPKKPQQASSDVSGSAAEYD